MTNIKASFSLLDNYDDISAKVSKALLPDVNKYLEKTFNKIKDGLTDIVQGAIINSPEYSSLVSGSLKAEFGLPDSELRLSTILGLWTNLVFEYKKVSISGGSLSGGFVLNVIKSDYSDVLSSEAAVLTTIKGTNLYWLEWLLLFGHKTIIKNYEVKLGSYPSSRSGMAVMSGVISGKWAVPNEFAGVSNDNWITRAIDSVDGDIQKLFSSNLGA